MTAPHGHIRRHNWLDRFFPNRFYRQTQASTGNLHCVFEFLRVREYSARTAFQSRISSAVLSSGLVCYCWAWVADQPAGAIAASDAAVGSRRFTARHGAP